ncbi:MAG: TetR/AcrR family transcriptional regulator [Mycolicibacterium sp.]|nr:TetR/AcrR family transcriptional regulator [Mycolicibacterium sp.]
MTTPTDPGAETSGRPGRDNLLQAALGLLDDHGPDALQTRRIAKAAATSTMAVYTHFGGMRGLIAAVAQAGLEQFDAALAVGDTDDPVADLLTCGMTYRRFALQRPHLYRLMFGSTSAHGINAPAHDIRTDPVAQVDPSLGNLVRTVGRAVDAGRITAPAGAGDWAVLAVAAQFWTMMHGFVLLELAGFFGPDAVEPVLGAMARHTLVGLGDDPAAAAVSQAAARRRADAKLPADPGWIGGEF